ncbi:MAG: hypothetical protein IT557_18900 [Alphaproteobacteria bacterium]|nr:hypothetical protein [Alphaproteobacteria bacterium]
MPTPADAIATYLRAKDSNRPHLMRRAFAADAVLEMAVHTGVVRFPPLSRGVAAIARVTAGDFGRVHENVYTFCLSAPPSADARTFTCPWLVGMSVKESGAVRVGAGRYDWHFQPAAPHLVERLVITIERMEELGPEALGRVTDWLAALPWPWCAPAAAAAGMPRLAALDGIARHLTPAT